MANELGIGRFRLGVGKHRYVDEANQVGHGLARILTLLTGHVEVFNASCIESQSNHRRCLHLCLYHRSNSRSNPNRDAMQD